jgi:hypothetical protein
MRRTRSLTATTTLLLALPLMAACGNPEQARDARVRLEPATVGGLAAAVLTHLDRDSTTSTGGNGNAHEKWKAVDFEVEADGLVVPVSVMVTEYTEETGRPSADDLCSEDDQASLGCRVDELDDGTSVGFLASTEDVTGGILRRGFIAMVAHLRDDEAVLVMEELPSRDPHLVDLTRLPVDVDVLEEIATDPLVGTRTSPELNAAGRELEPVG